MVQLQNNVGSSSSEFSTASPDEQYVGVTKEESGDTINSESPRGCEYQAVADGTLSLTMPSTTSDKGIEQSLDFDIEDGESISDFRAMLQDYVKRAEEAAVSEQQISHLSKQTSKKQQTTLSRQTSEGQQTALSRETSERQRTTLSRQTSEGQRTSLSKETSERQRTELSRETSERQQTTLSRETSERQQTTLSRQTSEVQQTALSKQTSEGQRTSLSKQTFQKQLIQAFQGIIQTIIYLAL